MIAEALGVGEESAVNAAVLCERLNMTARNIRKAVETERREGQPICSSVNGYYLASSREEMKRFCNYLMSKKDSTTLTLSACLEMLDGLPESEDN